MLVLIQEVLHGPGVAVTPLQEVLLSAPGAESAGTCGRIFSERALDFAPLAPGIFQDSPQDASVWVKWFTDHQIVSGVGNAGLLSFLDPTY